MNYDYWRKALAGEKPKMFVDDPQPGFYRSGIYDKEPNKARKRVGWSPVAIFAGTANTGGGMMAAIGVGSDRQIILDRDKINDLWSYCAANPISEETYRAVAERGEPWPDSHETVPSIPVANSSMSIDRTDAMIRDRKQALDVIAAKVMADVAISNQIDEAAKQLAKYTAIDSDEMASKARSLQQKFLDLRSEAAKAYETANRPLLEQQKQIRSIWFPIRDKADDAARQLREAMGRWEDTKRKAAQDAAERAEAGQEGVSNVPPPSTQIKGVTGRAASVTVETVVTSIDVDAVFQQFKASPQVVELLTILAQKAIKSGIPVPGASTEQRSVVR